MSGFSSISAGSDSNSGRIQESICCLRGDSDARMIFPLSINKILSRAKGLSAISFGKSEERFSRSFMYHSYMTFVILKI